MLQLWRCGSLGRCKLYASVCRTDADLGSVRTAPRPPISMTSRESPRHSASTTPVVDPFLTCALRPPRSRARNHGENGKTRTVGEMDMGPHFPSTSENRGERRNDRGWRPWMRERGRTKKTTSSPGTSRTERHRRTSGAITKSNMVGS